MNELKTKIHFLIQPKKGTPLNFEIDKDEFLKWLNDPKRPIYIENNLRVKDESDVFMTIYLSEKS